MQFALSYLKQGLSIIPLKHGEKIPLLQSWKEYQTRKPTEAEVREWWTKHPTANIGIVTGPISGVAVVDLDGPDGLNAAKSISISSSVRSLTGNGEHLWFKYPTAGVSNAARLYPGLDIRGAGGYVLGAPSIHSNGKRYRWISRFVNHASLPEFPKVLLTAPSVSSNTKQESWMSEALEDFKNGHVANTLVSILGKFRAHNFDEESAYAFLSPHNTSGKLSDAALREKITEIWGRYEPNAVVSVPVPATGDVSEAESVESFFETEEEVKWIIPSLIASQSLGFVVGLPETSKTWAMIDLAIEAAKGGRWLDSFVTKKCRVWFIDQERYRGETKRRFKALCKAKHIGPEALKDLRINSGNTTFRLDLDQSYAAFRKRIAEYQPDLVIVDSLATFHTKEENNRTEIQQVLERIKALRNEFGCTFLFIHHENKLSFESKEEGREPTLKEMSGNIAIPAAAETVIVVRKRADGASLVYHVKSTLAKTHKPFEIRVMDVDGPDKIEVKGYL